MSGVRAGEPAESFVEVGWCHQCGTVQLKTEMPAESLPWTDGPEPCCVECRDEPWGLGVWDKGRHLPGCPWHTAGAAREVDWTPAFDCTCAAQLNPERWSAASDAERWRLARLASWSQSERARAETELQQVIDEYQDLCRRGEQAGYTHGSKRPIVHRWECPTIQAYLREIEDRLSGERDLLLVDVRHGSIGSFPPVLTAAEARAYLAAGRTPRSRRTCKTCSPDL